MDPILKTSGLSKRYDRAYALRNLSVSIPRGSIYGLVGRNGAGKSTFMRLICGLQEPTAGSYSLYGVAHNSRQINRVRRHIGAVIETPAAYPNMTARQNLIHQNRILGVPNDDNVKPLLELVGLEDTGKKKVRNFSLGMRQRMGIAIAMAGTPDLLVLDEPTNGLDPQGIVEMRELILKLNREHGVTVIVSSHILGELSKIATHYGFIHNGELVCEMSAEELSNTCRRCIAVQVSNIQGMIRALDQKNIEYRVLSENTAEVYDGISVSRLAAALAEENCEILTANNRDEDLEAFFINLVGGDGQ